MSSPVDEQSRPPAGERLVREHADLLRRLAAEHGITDLRFASAGRLVGRVAADRDLFDVADFEIAAVEILDAEIRLYSDGVLRKTNVSPDLVAAAAL